MVRNELFWRWAQVWPWGFTGNERSTPRFPSVARPRGPRASSKPGGRERVAATEICQFYQGINLFWAK
jgi:hypothetical protein